VAQFNASGHYRAALQVESKEKMTILVQVHEGQNHPELKNASGQTGCVQCHGVRLELDENGRPLADLYPTSGMGNIYPNGEVGNCAVCHTRHSFSIEEARKPEACASCHLGPDHPDIEVYENSKHGHIYATEGETWDYSKEPGDWEPGDYRAPTCAVCHMSGIGDLQPTHNVSQRLYWNAWAPESKPRNSDDPMSPLTGDAEAGRAEMKQVCGECHTSTLVEGYFKSADDAVRLYNEAYYQPAVTMLNDLKERGLLKDNPWADEFQKLYYHLWHHEGRRARHGALMGAPDWAHWHGFFELQQDLYRMQDIYDYRIATGEIGEP
ncbi:MAG: beta-ketoacyl-ACP synthase, partial [Anaerolineae bacterium]